jgi:HD-like signal output (HDOD) protein
MKRRILLVDGASQDLAELQAALRPAVPEWEFHHLRHGGPALAFLRNEACDAVVADLQLEDMPGLELAARLLGEQPRTHRILLADLGEPQALFGCVGGVHQFLSKPCEPERLKAELDRAFEFQVWLPNQTVRALMGRIPNLPSRSADYAAVIQELRKDEPAIEAAAAAIAQDPPMTAKILQLANAAAYGMPLDESDPIAATRDLGATNTRTALLLAHRYSGFEEANAAGLAVDALLAHARLTRQLATRIAEAEHLDRRRVAHAATGALLHDLGKIALAVNLPELYRQRADLIRARHWAAWEAEQELFGATHAEVGACLLATWSLPLAVVEAVALHHHPTRFLHTDFSPLTAVHVGNAFAHAERLDDALPRLDLAYLNDVGVADRLPAWWDACASLRTADTPALARTGPEHHG